MEKIKIFFVEIGKSLGIFCLYLFLSLLLSGLFNNVINSNNFWLSNLTALLIEAVVMLVLFFIYYKKIIADFKEFKTNHKSIMNTAFKNWVLGLAIMFVSNIIITMIVGNMANNEAANRTLLLSTPLYAITTMILVAPISEEIIFRLSFRKAFTKKIPYLIYSAIFFGSMHLLSSTSWLEILYIIPYGALGYFFAKTFYETDNICSSIVMHMIHNTVAVLLAYVSLLG